MSRYEIEDIVEQDKHGVVFRARDVESGDIVSLRRFLLFGQEGGGLEHDEAAAYGSAAERLASISHVALRSIIMGSVDPIDGIPFLVTEWVDGEPLHEVLGGESMDPALVIDVLRLALEVSIVLSEALGEEAVWVETEVGSIVIGSKESGRGFTFWISPFKWLGAQFGSRKLSSIAELGEELAGWKGKTVADKSGYGLGGWLKWLRKNPDARLSEALEMLDSSISTEAPPPKPGLIGLADKSPAPPAKPSHRKKVVMAAAAAMLLLISAALFFLKKTSDIPEAVATKTGESPTSGNVRSSSASLTAAERATARAMELRTEAASPPAAEAPAQDARTPLKNEGKPRQGETIYTPDDKKLWAAIKVGESVKLGGILRTVALSPDGKRIYLHFSEPADSGKLSGVVHRTEYKGDFREETFRPYVGKKLVLTGTCFKEPGGRVVAKISDKGLIRVVE